MLSAVKGTGCKELEMDDGDASDSPPAKLRKVSSVPQSTLAASFSSTLSPCIAESTAGMYFCLVYVGVICLSAG